MSAASAPSGAESKLVSVKDMEGRRIVQVGYNAIAEEYLAGRTKDSQDADLLRELVQRLPEGAEVLD